MRRTVVRAALPALCLLLLASSGFAADVKFRYAASAYADREGRGMKGTEGVACNDDFTVVAADTGNGRLIRYTFDGEQFKGGDEVRLPEGTYPTRLQLGSKGQVYCLDAYAHRILRIASPDATPERVELAGIPEPTNVLVRSFRLDRQDSLYVLDSLNARVLVLDAKGQYVKTLSLPATAASLDDLAVDQGGSVYVLDGVAGVLYTAAKGTDKFVPVTTKLKEFVNFATDLTVDNRGAIYLADHAGSGIAVLTPDGSLQARYGSVGWKDGLLQHPAQLCVNAKESLLVADRDNSRVQLFWLAK